MNTNKVIPYWNTSEKILKIRNMYHSGNKLSVKVIQIFYKVINKCSVIKVNILNVPF